MKQAYWYLTGLWLLVAIMFLYGSLTISPDAQIAIHWNINFEVDRWAGKRLALSFGPIICTLIPLLFWLLPKIEPRQQHLQDSMSVLGKILILVQLLMALIYIATILTTQGVAISIPRIVIMGVGILFLVIGNYLGKVQSNFTLGIRTPWTLSSENVWNKTHRLSGKAFMAIGLLGLILGGTQATWALHALLVSTLSVVLGIIVYSWWLWTKEQ